MTSSGGPGKGAVLPSPPGASKSQVGIGGEVPEWAQPYLGAFRDALRVVGLSDHFILLPVEVSGPDVAEALAAFLTAEGERSVVVQPLTDDDWRAIAASLFEVNLDGAGVLVVIGTREVTAEVVYGLRLVNQRRDTIARHIGRPLLWCGPHEFLDATWEGAPDFWSIRAMTHTVEGVLSLPPEPSVGPSHGVSDGTERLRAIFAEAEARGDGRSMARVGLHLATALLGELAYEEADALLVLALKAGSDASDSRIRTSLRLMRAQLALLRGALDDARALYESAPPRDAATQGQRLLVGGNLALARDAAAAEALYSQAEESFAEAHDRRNVAVCQWSLANAAVALERLEEGASRFERALALFRELADASNEAHTLSSLGRVHAALHDMRKANAFFDDALAITREVGDKHGEATVLRRLARIYVTLSDPEKAMEDCERALAISRSLGDVRGEGKSLLVLGAAHAALGQRGEAQDVYARALSLADALGDARMRTAVERQIRSLPALVSSSTPPPPSVQR